MTQTKLAPEYISELVDQGDRQRLRLLLNDQYPADLAECLNELAPSYRISCFRLLDLDNASNLLAELEPDFQNELLRDLGDISIVALISNMSPDDAVDLLSELPQEKARAILSQVSDAEAKEDLTQLLSFKEDTAGGIMSTDYLCLQAKMTVAEGLVYLREEYADLEEEIYDVYVVNEEEVLVGRVSLRELLTASPEVIISSVMEEDVVYVACDVDQEEAAEKLSRYDLLTLPVVDKKKILLGIITADDVIDVLKEEAIEDIYQSSGITSSGADNQEMLTYNVRKAFAARLPWLLITLIIESGSATVINHFDDVITQMVQAAAFMPLLSGVTGSVATQSTCIVIQGSSNKTQVSLKSALRNIFHETKVGMLLGLFCGLTAYLVGRLLHSSSYKLCLMVGASLFITMTVGVIIGTLMPILFRKLKVEPAHASGPFITSILDVSTMTIYLTIVHFFLRAQTLQGAPFLGQ
jgi:magnesium transporter